MLGMFSLLLPQLLKASIISAWTDYLEFFNSEIEKMGMMETVEKYFFDPNLFGRIMSGILHPFIHIGYPSLAKVS